MIKPFRYQVPSDGALSKSSALWIAQNRFDVKGMYEQGCFDGLEGFDGFEYDAGRGVRGVLQLSDFGLGVEAISDAQRETEYEDQQFESYDRGQAIYRC